MKTLISALIAASLFVAPAMVTAHGTVTAKHGGVVVEAHDLNFELVSTTDGAHLYIVDHGQPMKPTNMSGKLTVLNGAEQSEAPLKAEADRLEAAGIKLVKGAKVVAILSAPTKKTMTVRFVIK